MKLKELEEILSKIPDKELEIAVASWDGFSEAVAVIVDRNALFKRDYSFSSPRAILYINDFKQVAPNYLPEIYLAKDFEETLTLVNYDEGAEQKSQEALEAKLDAQHKKDLDDLEFIQDD